MLNKAIFKPKRFNTYKIAAPTSELNKTPITPIDTLNTNFNKTTATITENINAKISKIVSFPSYMFFICQSIDCSPFFIKISLAFEKCLHPKKPLYADNGLGCGAFNI